MKQYKIDSEKEEKNKKRGLFVTTFFHIGAILLAFFPLMGAIEDIPLAENVVQMVEMDMTMEDDVKFVDNVEDAARKGDSMDDSKSTDVKEKPEPTPAPEPQPEPKPIDVVDDQAAPVVPTGDNPKATDIPVNEAPKTDPVPDPTPTPTNPSGKTPSDDNKPGGNSTKPGVSGDGGDDNDLQEGVFGRRVMKRPNIKGLTKTKGRIAIKVCVSQEGTVIATKFLQKFSSIYDAKLVAAAMGAARRYKFDVDYTAPKKQWGKLTFIFDI